MEAWMPKVADVQAGVKKIGLPESAAVRIPDAFTEFLEKSPFPLTLPEPVKGKTKPGRRERKRKKKMEYSGGA